MDTFVIEGSGRLNGEVAIGGAKNSVLKLMAATVLAPGTYVLSNVPRISDVEWMADVMVALGMTVEWEKEDQLVITSSEEITPEAPYHLVERMRASTSLIGALLSRCGVARVAMPGGDDFGTRPIDMHLDVLTAFGAHFEPDHGTIGGSCELLVGALIVL